MTFVSAFVTMLSISSIKSRGYSTNPVHTHNSPKNEPPRPHMLACDSEGKCPDGSMCMKLVGKYGVCVVEDYE